MGLSEEQNLALGRRYLATAARNSETSAAVLRYIRTLESRICALEAQLCARAELQYSMLDSGAAPEWNIKPFDYTTTPGST